MWPRAKLKFVARLGYGDALPNDESQDGAFRVFGSNGPFASFSRANTGAPAIVIGRKGSYGKVNWTAEPCFASDTTFFVDESTSRNHLRWIYWLLQTLRLDEGTDEAAVPGLNRETVYSRDVLVPPLPQQRVIADYLDREAARLDALMAAKERVLGLLAEKRRALITRAVTLGLNPSAPRRDSGIPWLGEIPAHWEIERLRYLTQRGLSPVRQQQLDRAFRVTFLPMDAIGEQGKLDVSTPRDIEEVRSGYTLCFDGDVLVAKITPCFENGKGALVSNTLGGVAYGTTELYVLTPKSGIDGRFLYYVTVETRFRRLGAARMTGAAGQQRVPEDFIRDYRMPIPPLVEQRAIADRLDRELARLDVLASATQGTIGLLKERRAALIAAAVTGQIDVEQTA